MLRFQGSTTSFKDFHCLPTRFSSSSVCHSFLLPSPLLCWCGSMMSNKSVEGFRIKHTHKLPPPKKVCFLKLNLFLWDPGWKHRVQHNQCHSYGDFGSCMALKKTLLSSTIDCLLVGMYVTSSSKNYHSDLAVESSTIITGKKKLSIPNK